MTVCCTHTHTLTYTYQLTAIITTEPTKKMKLFGKPTGDTAIPNKMKFTIEIVKLT